MIRVHIAILITMLVLTAVPSCTVRDSNQEALKAEVTAALDALAEDLLENRPADAAAYTERLQTYLEAHPRFFGSAAALLDHSGAVIASPYVYRTANGYASLDLAAPSYNIEKQDWFTLPLAKGAGIWTEPYFDTGGGEVWMITRAIPLSNSEGVFAVITTDIVVDDPTQ